MGSTVSTRKKKKTFPQKKFRNMSSYNKKNPSHGQKVSSDPLAHTDLKHEYAGPIAYDSLAAESLRAGGLFSQGNPADIFSVKGAQGTFASHPKATGLHYQEIQAGHKRGDQEVFETGKAGGIDEDFKTKSARVGTLSGGNEPMEPPRPTDKKGNYIRRSELARMEAEQKAAQQSEKQGGEHKAGKEEHPKLSLRGGAAGDEDQHRRRSAHHALPASRYAPSTTSHETGTVGNDAVKSKETPDWSKVPKDTMPTANIGGQDDPSRDASAYLARAARKQVGKSVHDKEGEVNKNPYEGLKDDED